MRNLILLSFLSLIFFPFCSKAMEDGGSDELEEGNAAAPKRKREDVFNKSSSPETSLEAKRRKLNTEGDFAQRIPQDENQPVMQDLAFFTPYVQFPPDENSLKDAPVHHALSVYCHAGIWGENRFKGDHLSDAFSGKKNHPLENTRGQTFLIPCTSDRMPQTEKDSIIQEKVGKALEHYSRTGVWAEYHFAQDHVRSSLERGESPLKSTRGTTFYVWGTSRLLSEAPSTLEDSLNSCWFRLPKPESLQ